MRWRVGVAQFTLESVETRQFEHSPDCYIRHPDHWTVIVITEGEGLIRSDGSTNHICRHSAMIVKPHSSYEISSGIPEKLSLTELAFSASPPDLLTEAGLDHQHETKVVPIKAQHCEIVERLCAATCQFAANMERMQANVLFQQFLLELLQQMNQINKQADAGTRQAVAQTLDYIDWHYDQELTVEALARLANLGRWQYTRVFKELTGKSPMNYVSERRIKHARSLLITAENVKDVAGSVGFADPYYFSRRFKQIEGMAPVQFIQTKKAEPRLICGHYSIESAHMGVKPVAAASHVRLEKTMKDIGHTGNLNLERIASLSPDLIVIHELDKHVFRSLSDIAPTIYIPYFSGNPLECYRLVAEALGKSKEASEWLVRYEEQAEDARNMLFKRGIGRKETAVSRPIEKSSK